MIKSLRSISYAFVAVLILTGFGGCQTPPKPENIEQGIAYSYTVHASATNAVTAALKVNKISVAQAENALEISKQVKNGLDLAQKLVREGKPKDAAAQLKLAETVLKGLQTFAEEYKN